MFPGRRRGEARAWRRILAEPGPGPEGRLLSPHRGGEPGRRAGSGSEAGRRRGEGSTILGPEGGNGEEGSPGKGAFAPPEAGRRACCAPTAGPGPRRTGVGERGGPPSGPAAPGNRSRRGLGGGGGEGGTAAAA